MDELERRLDRSQTLYLDLVDALDPERLRSTLGALPSNTIGSQLWCVTGARHSYSLAARSGTWPGFSSPMSSEDAEDPAAARAVLESTHATVIETLGSGLDEDGTRWMWDLLEHEVQHQGQLIRYLYALSIPRPASWRERYALE